MRKDELRGMTRQELLEQARSHDIRGRTGMSKEELVSALASVKESSGASAAAGGGEGRKPRKRDAQPSARGAKAEGPKASEERSPNREPGPGKESTAIARSTPPEDRRTRPAHHKPAPGNVDEEAEDEEGRKWNSVALGRDPNYGRFLNPGSVPPRAPAGRGRRPGPPTAPGQQESLAERSERGRMRAGERSYAPHDVPRRGGDVRRAGPYPNRYARPGEHPGGPRGDRDRPERERSDRDRPHTGRYERNRPGEPAGRGRERPSGGGDRERRYADRDRRGPEHERRGPERSSPGALGTRPFPRREGAEGRGHDANLRKEPRQALPPEERPVLEPPRVQGDFEGYVPESDQELEQAGNWEAIAPPSAPAPPSQTLPPAAPKELPAHYGLDRCRLMVRDPHTIYAYWEVQAQTLDFVRGQMGNQWEGGRRLLRIHGIPVSGNPDEAASDFFDLECGTDATNWYITVPYASRAYRVDVGILTQDELFYPLASSNTVITPRDEASPNHREQWAPPPGGKAETGTPPAPAETGSIEPAPAERERPAGRAHRGRTGQEPAETSSKAGEPDLGPSSAALFASGQGLTPGGPGIPPSGAAPGITEEAPSSFTAPLAPDQTAAKEAGFHFVLNTELIVYGATRPDARVTVQGMPVPLRADGTFSLRFLLPDGTQVLDAVARSHDGQEVRKITPKITRSTSTEEEQ